MTKEVGLSKTDGNDALARTISDAIDVAGELGLATAVEILKMARLEVNLEQPSLDAYRNDAASRSGR